MEYLFNASCCLPWSMLGKICAKVALINAVHVEKFVDGLGFHPYCLREKHYIIGVHDVCDGWPI